MHSHRQIAIVAGNAELVGDGLALVGEAASSRSSLVIFAFRLQTGIQGL